MHIQAGDDSGLVMVVNGGGRGGGRGDGGGDDGGLSFSICMSSTRLQKQKGQPSVWHT